MVREMLLSAFVFGRVRNVESESDAAIMHTTFLLESVAGGVGISSEKFMTR
jgi:hypothetical protein